MNLIGLTRQELAFELEKMGEKPFRAKQLWHWIYWQGKTSFDEMTSLGKPLRQKLIDNGYTLERPTLVKEQSAQDGTRKWLLAFRDKQSVETVYIPEEDRGAVCLSTQIGCPNGCVFCHTGSQRMVRNLTTCEFVSQFMVARDSYDEWSNPPQEPRYLSNIVIMGMGEPLLNYETVKKGLEIITDSEGLCISKRRITLSTCGIVPKIPSVAKDLGVKLAISLHAPNDAIRDRIMPINRKYPLRSLMEACKQYQALAGTRHYITMEYVMLDGINDSDENAFELMDLVKGLRVKFNLIPFNEWQGCDLRCSSKSRIKRFSSLLEGKNYAAPIRQSRGQEIMAACGQLKTQVSRGV